MKREEWRAVDGFPGYEVSSRGGVRSFLQRQGLKGRRGSRTVVGASARALKPAVHKDGRHFVALYRDGRSSLKRVHVLVLEAFIGARPRGMLGCHGNLGNQNNSVANLDWGTVSRNNGADRVRDGTAKLGEDLSWTKLTAINVSLIRNRLRQGRSQIDISQEFDVTRRTINHIANGKTWGWLK
jgi:hypothetical protein